MKRIIILYLSISIVLFISCKQIVEPEAPIDSNGIFFSVDGNIYKMNYDGSNKTQLTFDKEDNNNPKISANGKYLLFETQGLKDITASGGLMYDFSIINIMVLHNKRIERVSDDTEKDWFPQFSPDENEIVFSSTRTDNCDIYKIDLNEKKTIPLTNNNDWNVNPQFSPDGSKVLFESHTNGNYNLFIMDSDGSNQRQITESNWNNNPQFSPNGNRILWETYRDIFTMNSDGSNKVNITNNNKIFARTPSFSHNGNKVIFISEETYNVTIEESVREIHTIDLNTNERKIIYKTGANFEPKYFPSDNKIIFTQYYNNKFHICTINNDGSDYRRLSKGGDAYIH